MKKAYDVLVMGRSLFCDLIFTGLPEPPALGREVYAQELTITAGGALSTAVALKRLGLRPGLVAELGNDPFSRFVLHQIETENLDTTLLRQHPGPLPVITVAFSLAEDRGFISYAAPSTFQPPGLGLLEQAQASVLHFGNLHLASKSQPLMEAARARGMWVTSDCQWPPLPLAEPATRQTLSLLDCFMPNAEEARAMTESGTAEEALHHLALHAPQVVIKDGCQGAWGLEGARWVRVAPLSVEAVDTTGAGDCFNAGYLLGCLEGLPLEMRLHYGNICGACAVRAAGGYTATPTRKEFEDWLRRFPKPNVLEEGQWPG